VKEFSPSPILNIKYFKTNKYKYSIYEAQSGMKFILLTSNEVFDFTEILYKIYEEAFLEFV
jgi:hypothetical protein